MSTISRAELLLQQNKYDLAEKELQLHLAENPNDAFSHAYLALAYSGLGKDQKALEAAKQSVSLIPDASFPLYVLSRCYVSIDNLKDALATSEQALRFAPDDADFLCNHGAILCDLKKYEEAITALNSALENDPEHAGSKQIKSIVLRNQGRYKEADDIAQEALEDNPEDAHSFAAKGWTALDSGNTKESLQHFKSAVMIDPNSEFAKSGMVMALKAQNPLFNLFYKFHTWIASLSPSARWGFIIGIYVFMRVLRKVSETNSPIAPVLGFIFALYILFAFLSWTIDPIFNIFMRFNQYAKYALNRGEIIASNIMAFLLISAATQYLLTFALPWYPITGAIGALFLTLPVSGTFNRWDTKKFIPHLVYTIALSILWVANIVLPIAGNDIPSLWFLFLGGTIAYTWISQMGK
ncbi:tetratricopeptide repeat protein [Labilibacter marinus]|uniref:tetratricopeptide repeat protein n=1 Tax=Labilibacter marinus TaxID=1477105 RepID=UPI000833D65F|nr:tetratricopeptide repeat protein [Labilibacter marinus]